MNPKSPIEVVAPAAEGAVAELLLALGDGRSVVVSHGDIIGRTASCTLQVDEPGISEAHALVSLRGGAFHLLALRGRLAVHGDLLNDVLLVEGCEVALTPSFGLRVLQVQLPTSVLAIAGPGLPRQALPASCTLVTRPSLRLRPRFTEDAIAWIWFNGTEWKLREAGSADTRVLQPGQRLVLDGVPLDTSLIPLAGAGAVGTIGPALASEPLTIETAYDVVRVRRGDTLAVTLTGQSACLISELGELGGLVNWDVLAREVWPEAADDRDALRRRFDIGLVRLRKKLRAVRVRSDLVRPVGTGVVELVLHPGDRLLRVG